MIGVLEETRAEMRAKVESGVKQVRVTTMLRTLDEIASEVAEIEKFAKKARKDADRATRVAESAAAQSGGSVDPGQDAEGMVHPEMLMGLAEVAAFLRIEKQRIARYRESGVIPEPVATVQSGPLWIESQIAPVAAVVEARRRNTGAQG